MQRIARLRSGSSGLDENPVTSANGVFERQIRSVVGSVVLSVLPIRHEGTPVAAPIAGVMSVGDWHVLHTKSRQEKILSEDLLALEIPHYLPLVKSVRYYGKRK